MLCTTQSAIRFVAPIRSLADARLTMMPLAALPSRSISNPRTTVSCTGSSTENRIMLSAAPPMPAAARKIARVPEPQLAPS